MYHIAAAEYACTCGHAVGALARNNKAAVINLNAFGGRNNSCCRALADSQNYAVARQGNLAAFFNKLPVFRFNNVLHQKPCKFSFVAFGSFLAHGVKRAHLFFVKVGNGLLQKVKLHAFFNGCFVFGGEAGNLGFRFVVNNRNIFSAAADCRACGVHSHVACADNDNVIADMQQCFAFVQFAAVGKHNHAQEVGGG